jgi:putative tryptophan/tyrosine transport system substrate-binding protein
LDAVVVVSTPAALAVKNATKTIPVVMAASADPVGGGVVESLVRPGGNITGLALMNPDLTGKRIEVLARLFQVSRGSPPCIVAPRTSLSWRTG